MLNHFFRGLPNESQCVRSDKFAVHLPKHTSTAQDESAGSLPSSSLPLQLYLPRPIGSPSFVTPTVVVTPPPVCLSFIMDNLNDQGNAAAAAAAGIPTKTSASASAANAVAIPPSHPLSSHPPPTSASSSSSAAAARKTTRRLTDKELNAAVLNGSIFDAGDVAVKHDILQVVIQYLQDEGYHGSALVVQDEANVKAKHLQSKRSQLRRMKRAILDGDWSEVEHLLTRNTFRNMLPFKYAVYRQQFLELIDGQQIHNALSLLQLRLKPLEGHAPTPNEFRDLCYLLTCKGVTDAAAFRDWDGVITTRAALVEQYGRLLDVDASLSMHPNPNLNNANANHVAGGSSVVAMDGSGGVVYSKTDHSNINNNGNNNMTGGNNSREVPRGRLLHLLQQALAFQILSSKHHPVSIHVPPRISTLLQDYQPPVVPNARRLTCTGHSASVKAVAFLGAEGHALVSASSDQTLRLWHSTSGTCLGVLRGHAARVWDCCTVANGTLLASCAGDGVIKLWNTQDVAERLSMSGGLEELEEEGDDDDDDDVDGDDEGDADESGDKDMMSSHLAAARRSKISMHSTVNSDRKQLSNNYSSRVGTRTRMKRRKRLSFHTPCVATVHDHQKDCYAVRFHAHANALASGGYDRVVRLHDVTTLSSSLKSSSSSFLSFPPAPATTTAAAATASSLPSNSISASTSSSVPPSSSPPAPPPAPAPAPKQLSAFHGHRGSVTAVTFNARGNLVISASKDCTVRLWDALSGVCVRTLSAHLGEVTSVEASVCGTLLLTAAKDNSVRLWDVRMTNRALARFKGYQNTAKNFVRAEFGPREALVVAGSEDGFIYLWDKTSLKVVAKLGLHSPSIAGFDAGVGATGAELYIGDAGGGGGGSVASGSNAAAGRRGALQQGAVYRATWNARQSVLASCAHDGVVTTWVCVDDEKLLSV